MVAKQTGLSRARRKPSPLDRAGLEELALAYVARFATSRGKLLAYLRRKIRERGTAEEGDPPQPEAVVERLARLGYVDDEGFARARAQGLLRRGYGARRVHEALHAAGIDEGLRAALAPGEAARREAALALARKRRFGPFGKLALSEPRDFALREKQIAAMLRAGHDYEIARAVIDAGDMAEAEQWASEAQD